MIRNDWLDRATKQIVSNASPAQMTRRIGGVFVDVNGVPESNATHIYDPDLTAVAGQPEKYWIVPTPTGDAVTLTTNITPTFLRDAIDAAEDAAIVASQRAGAIANTTELSDLGIQVRALIELFNKRDNFLTNRIIELQARGQAMLDSVGGVGNMRTDGLAVSISATATRTKAAAITAFAADINAGNQDT